MNFDWIEVLERKSGENESLRMCDDVLRRLDVRLGTDLLDFSQGFVQDPGVFERLDSMIIKHMKRKQSHLVYKVEHSPDWRSHRISGLSSSHKTVVLESMEGLDLRDLDIAPAIFTLVQALSDKTMDFSSDPFRGKSLEAFTLLSIADRVAGVIGSARYLRHDFAVWIITPSTTELLGIAKGGIWTNHSPAMGNFQFLPWTK
jgi:hypothetical protein